MDFVLSPLAWQLSGDVSERRTLLTLTSGAEQSAIRIVTDNEVLQVVRDGHP